MKILIFGDSIAWGESDETGGWAEHIRQRYIRLSKDDVSHQVYNCSISGDRMKDIQKRFESEVEPRISDRDVLIIFAVGINDAQRYIDNEDMITPITEFERRFQNIIAKAQPYADELLTVGLLPVDEDRVVPKPWEGNLGYYEKDRKRYNKSLKKICDEKDISFIDVSEEINTNSYKKNLIDGLHPNEKGHEMIYNILLPKISSIVE